MTEPVQLADTPCVLVVNAGSSSLKFSLLTGPSPAALTNLLHGEIEGIGTAAHFVVQTASGQILAQQRWTDPVSFHALLAHLMAWLTDFLGQRPLLAAGHRVAHGGLHAVAPRWVNAEVIAELQALTPLAPLHQPHNVAPMKALAALYPKLPQVACFDTAFHADSPRLSRLYGLPHALTDQGLCRFGFHGLSYEYIAIALAQQLNGQATGRSIVAHLGNGASMCAMLNGQSVASTMGFSALDGLLMGSRCGALDPGVLLYLLQEKNMNAEALQDLLYHRSGLLGVSGVSNDMRALLASAEPRAQEAIDLYVYRAVREIGSLAAAVGGLDHLVFTAGVGEHAPLIRQRICQQSAWLGVALDDAANQANDVRISAPGSAVSVWVLPTDEALMVARHTLALLQTAPG